MTITAKVLLPLPFNEPFDYAIPEDKDYKINDIVKVPFGKNTYYGVIWDIGESDKVEKKYKLKNIISSAHEDGFECDKISDELKKFIDKQSGYYLSELGKVLSLTYSQKFFKRTKDRKKKEVIQTSKTVRIATLNDEQGAAFNKISAAIDRNEFSVLLLDGITGSGKTEVYFEAARKIIASGKQVLIMLPEILLTSQMIRRFEASFHEKPVIWHSGITELKKKKYFHDIAVGKAKVVIGARSALHLPYKALGLVVCDEEHDQSYKQEEQIIYNARDMAILRSSIEKSICVLISATPSAETYNNAITGKYEHIKLSSRYSKIELPKVEVVDMRVEKLDSKHFISSRLKEEIENNLKNKLQTLLFLNRRGYAPLLLCGKCGYRFESPDTSAWMVIHRKPSGEYYLECHHSGYRMDLPKSCPACNEENTFRSCGPGVQRLTDEIKELYPNAHVAELSSDSISSTVKAEEFIRKVENNEIDIIIGTQIIAKGHHFPGLKTVGIIDADLGLDFTDLRAPEKVFQILHQVSGRAGRENIRGNVLMQTYMPDNKVIQALAKNDRDAFLNFELAERKDAKLPPFSRLASIIISSELDSVAEKHAKFICSELPQIKEVSIYGPAKAVFHRLRGSYRYRILLKTDKSYNIQKYIASSLNNSTIPNNVKVKIDIDPYNFS